ncbi:MAG: hypothetical protein IT365_13525 [Candidatus Hydrogenedentes bacterium]|nr:hypothetical protein [Candidatus Hydrogenedentota bacterium]
MLQYLQALEEFIEGHQEVVMIALTAIYVLATTVIMMLNARTVRRMEESNRLSREALQQNVLIERQRSRPYVIADLLIEKHLVYATLANIGRTPAREVVVKFDPVIYRDGSPRYCEICFVKDAVSFLAPGREIRDFIDSSPSFLDRYGALTFQVNVNYKDTDGEEFRESCQISLAPALTHMTVDDERDVRDALRLLKDVGHAVQGIERLVDKGVATLELSSKLIAGRRPGSNVEPTELVDKLVDFEIELLKKIGSAGSEGSVYKRLLSNENSRLQWDYREALERLAILGILLEEPTRWQLTALGWRVVDAMELKKPQDH